MLIAGMKEWMDVYLVSLADFAGAADITNLAKEREPGIEIIECTSSQSLLFTRTKFIAQRMKNNTQVSCGQRGKTQLLCP